MKENIYFLSFSIKHVRIYIYMLKHKLNKHCKLNKYSIIQQ